MKKKQSAPATRGPTACYRSPVRGVCCACDQWASPIHNPTHLKGIWCGQCCPVCNLAQEPPAGLGGTTIPARASGAQEGPQGAKGG